MLEFFDPTKFHGFVATALIGGAIGGIGQVVSRLSLREVMPPIAGGPPRSVFIYDGTGDGNSRAPLSFWQLLGIFAGEIFLGMGGALGVTGVFALIRVFEADLATAGPRTVQMQVEVFGISVIGGYIARLILPMLGESLRKKIAETEDRVKETEKELEAQKKENTERDKELDQVRKQLDNTNELLQIEGAFSALASESLERRQQAYRDIRQLRQKYPAHRKITILAARFEVERVEGENESPRLSTAIDILTDFLSIPTVASDDYADVEYNRACYFSHTASLEKDADKKKNLVNSGLNDLEDSLRRKPGNKAQAQKDRTTDLAELAKNPRFDALVS